MGKVTTFSKKMSVLHVLAHAYVDNITLSDKTGYMHGSDIHSTGRQNRIWTQVHREHNTSALHLACITLPDNPKNLLNFSNRLINFIIFFTFKYHIFGQKCSFYYRFNQTKSHFI